MARGGGPGESLGFLARCGHRAIQDVCHHAIKIRRILTCDRLQQRSSIIVITNKDLPPPLLACEVPGCLPAEKQLSRQPDLT